MGLMVHVYSILYLRHDHRLDLVNYLYLWVEYGLKVDWHHHLE